MSLNFVENKVYSFFHVSWGFFALGQVEVNFKDSDYLNIFFVFGFIFNSRYGNKDKR